MLFCIRRDEQRLGKELLAGAGEVGLHLSTTSGLDPFIETQQGSIIYCL